MPHQTLTSTSSSTSSISSTPLPPATHTPTVVAPGIQAILEAEHEAALLIEQARQYRVQRLRDAKSEALHEIEALKQEKSREFARFEALFAGEVEEHHRLCQERAEREIKEIELIVAGKQQVIVDILVRAVTAVKQ